MNKLVSSPVSGLQDLYSILSRHYGPSGWWPGESALEIMVGAVLTQNTAWSNVEKAIDNLKKAGVLAVDALHGMDQDTLAQLIRPSGYYNIKAQRLKNLISLVMDTSGGDIDSFLDLEVETLRGLLLSVKGVGKESADSICLYAAGKPVFVVDAYTKRILIRHGIAESTWDYDRMQAFFMDNLPEDVTLYKDLHAYIVFIGKDFCRRNDPRCSACPLNGWTFTSDLNSVSGS